ncbi:glycosyltransferase family 2 protein [Bradyrhizobium canariense]|uniref:Glycosyltransferase involved in cell wall bisynthesis n=1 Tax=Bradyrhizobium canariense TaxID=255045 RepID=A0A1H1QF87_9BRAD|nr:glycosyltransferase family 2 protein [Bradyrhizobium canariense]SDS22034.1 Glycosyltransferase involved in cell wall bisynthesis [Bradyrhizobium canariense]
MSSPRPARRLTIVVPALNEQEKIADTIDGILPLARDLLDDFEIILIDDGSTDATGAIMDGFAAQEPRVVVVHHAQRQGVGAAFKSALLRAKFDGITLIPGDHAFQNEGIARMFKAAGAADIVITYRDNQSDRSLNRSIQSHSLRFVLNCMFGFWLFDYHSMIIYPVRWLRQIPVKADGYGYQICALISLLQLGLTHVQVPVSLNAELKGSSRALRPRTYYELGITIISLLRRVPIRNIDAGQIPAHTGRTTPR